MAARESFNAALREYEKCPGLGSADRAHLQRLANDDRAEEVWDKIQSAARSNNALLPPGTLITEILGTRRLAITIRHRGKLRQRYRNAANEMERVAKFLSEPNPYGMLPYPRWSELAGMLDDAASYFRKAVEASLNVPGVLKFSRKSQPHMIFMSSVSNYLKEITGHWLDKEVGVLAEIAFDLPDHIDPEDVRGARREGPGRKKTDLII